MNTINYKIEMENFDFWYEAKFYNALIRAFGIATEILVKLSLHRESTAYYFPEDACY